MAKNNPFVVVVFILFFIFLLLIMPFAHSQRSVRETATTTYVPMTAGPPVNTRLDNLYNPLVPPSKEGILPIPVRVPVNIRTQPAGTAYSQVGILTPQTPNTTADGALILPLMGRMSIRSRSQWQYYTLANGVGAFQAKLPISVSGKHCNDNGCDELFDGDVVQVPGYGMSFVVSMYENSTLQYLPNVL